LSGRSTEIAGIAGTAFLEEVGWTLGFRNIVGSKTFRTQLIVRASMMSFTTPTFVDRCRLAGCKQRFRHYALRISTACAFLARLEVRSLRRYMKPRGLPAPLYPPCVVKE
jgi:hypothetical protein